MRNVRLATEDDEEALFELLKSNYEENGIGPFSEFLVRDSIRQGTRAGGAIIGVIEDEDGNLIASIAMVMDHWWYSEPQEPGATILRERWLYTLPEHRDGDCFEALWSFATHISDRMSAQVGYPVPLLLGVMATERVEAKLRLYKRKLPLAGGAFLYRPDERMRH